MIRAYATSALPNLPRLRRFAPLLCATVTLALVIPLRAAATGSAAYELDRDDAAPVPPAAAPAARAPVDPPLPTAPVGPLRQLTDAQLRQVAASWAQLAPDQRRAVLTEIRARGGSPVLRLQGVRRFGYRIRRPDGSVVHIEREQRVVHYATEFPDIDGPPAAAQPAAAPVAPVAPGAQPPVFGTGFETRQGHPTSIERVRAETPVDE